MFFFLQGSTLLILTLAANTSFADFPRLANFAAGDSYMPRQLMKRGHRLVFSNGIVLLAASAMALMIATNASVSRLIPFYAVGVFTSFTMSQAGMTRHHLRKRAKGWQRGVFINGVGCALSFVVLIIFMSTKFTQGAWFILVLVPVLVVLLVRMNRQYLDEASELEEEAAELAGRRILPKLTVLVMVDQINRATARALQYGRSLHPSEIRAVHFVVDDERAQALAEQWVTLGLGRIPLDLVECSDRRIANAALQLTADEALMADREVTVLLPRLEYRRAWHRVLHDRTGNRIAEAVADLPRVNVTFVPYHLSAGRHAKSLSVADVIEQHASGQVPVVAAPGQAFGPDRRGATRPAACGALRQARPIRARDEHRQRGLPRPRDLDRARPSRPGAALVRSCHPRGVAGRRDRGDPARLPRAADDCGHHDGDETPGHGGRRHAPRHPFDPQPGVPHPAVTEGGGPQGVRQRRETGNGAATFQLSG